MAKYISPDEFISYTNGHAYDMDGSYGVQCVDGIKKFAYDVYGEYKFDCGSCGYAYGLWTNYGSNGVEKYFNKHPYSEARKGDWIVWNWGSESCKYSHVAMFIENKSNTVVTAYGQSQDGIKAFNFCNIYRDGILGVLRPKIYEENSFLPERGWFQYGDSGANVSKIDDWFANKVVGDWYGDYTVACVKEFQRQNGLEQDGCIGPITLQKMLEQGFKE